MWVVKLGGSLLGSPELGHWLAAICADTGEAYTQRRRLVVVPGGGPFADSVRQVQNKTKCSARAAHLAALKAMEQTALLLCDYGPPLSPAANLDAVHASWRRQGIPVWMPFDQLAANDAIAHTWDVTSDSLAAWLATALDADALVLVKSIVAFDHEPKAAVLRDAGIVDGAFPDFVRDQRFGVRLCRAAEHASFSAALRHGQPPGMHVQTGVRTAPARPAELQT